MKRLSAIFWAALMIKLIVAAALPLTNDEAYYWVWSQHPQWSYYDHPPVVAWLFALGEYVRWLPGCVRWPGVLLSHATLGLWLFLLRPYLTDTQRLVWLGLALLSPLVGGTALIVTPDLPLLFFYALALWCYLRWSEVGRWPWALALGLSLGCGFSSKYMMVLFALSLLPMVTEARVRGLLLRHLPLIVLGGVIGTFPVWFWNLQNGFVSLKFQAQHGLGREWKPFWTYEYIGLQILLIFPTVLYWALRTRRELPRVFFYLAWTPLVFFLATTSRGYVEGNWPIAGYPVILAFAAKGWPRARRALLPTLAFWGFAFAALIFIVGVRPGWSRALKFREFHQFNTLVTSARELEPLYARSYQMAARLHFELYRPVYKLAGMNRRDFYDFLPESTPSSRRYYLAVEKGDQLPAAIRERGDQHVETLPVDERFEIWTMEQR